MRQDKGGGILHGDLSGRKAEFPPTTFATGGMPSGTPCSTTMREDQCARRALAIREETEKQKESKRNKGKERKE